MRIGLQGPRAKGGGAETFEQELFEGLTDALPEHPHTLVVFSQHPRPVNLSNRERIEWVRVRGIGWRNAFAQAKRLTNWVLNNLLDFPSLFRDEHWLDWYLHHHQIEFFLNLIPETVPTAVPYMVFIWDLMHRGLPFFPECSQRGAWVRRENLFGRLIHRAAILGVGTEVGKREIMDCYQVPEGRLHVLPYPTPKFALEGRALPAAAPGSLVAGLGDYVLYPANFHAHKNHVTLLRAIALLRDRHGLVLEVVLPGADWGNRDHVKTVTAQLGLDRQVHFVGFVSRDELAGLYRGARALVFSSLLGPDNIPPLEAFGLGCPAIVADIPGAVEQMRGAALLFSPTDEAALAEAILKVHRDRGLRDTLVARGKERAREFTSLELGRSTLKLIGAFAVIRRCWAPMDHYPSRYNLGRLLGR